jgi:large-conductance mechanosensitive channel
MIDKLPNLLLANIKLEATVVSIINFIFLALFVVAGIRQIRKNRENKSDKS